MTRRTVTRRLLALAELGHAHWFCGNLYEAVVKVPDRMADDPAPTSPFGPGSPTRYYALAAPATAPAMLAALITGWERPASRPWLAVAAACSVSGTAATAYLVRTVNLKLFFGTEPIDAAERKSLLRTWYRVNTGRLLGTAVALAAMRRAKSRG